MRQNIRKPWYSMLRGFELIGLGSSFPTSLDSEELISLGSSVEALSWMSKATRASKHPENANGGEDACCLGCSLLFGASPAWHRQHTLNTSLLCIRRCDLPCDLIVTIRPPHVYVITMHIAGSNRSELEESSLNTSISSRVQLRQGKVVPWELQCSSCDFKTLLALVPQ